MDYPSHISLTLYDNGLKKLFKSEEIADIEECKERDKGSQLVQIRGETATRIRKYDGSVWVVKEQYDEVVKAFISSQFDWDKNGEKPDE